MSRRLLALLAMSACTSSTQESLVGSTAVAAGASGYLVVWDDLVRDTHTGLASTSRLLAKRVTSGGGVDGTAVLVSPTGIDPAIAWDGTQWVVAQRSSVTLVSADGANVGTTTLPTVGDPPSVEPSVLDAAIACSGSECLIVQTGAAGIVGVRVDQAGTLLDTTPIAIAAGGVTAKVGYDGMQFWVIWQAPGADSFYALQGARVGVDGKLLDAQPVTIEPRGFGIAYLGEGTRPAIACAPGTCLAVYNGVSGRRLGAAGTVLDASPIQIALPLSNCNIDRLAVAYDGASFLVGGGCFQSDEGVLAARVATDGQLLDGTGLTVSSTASQTIGLAVAGSVGFLAAWEDRRSGEDIYAARVDDTGAVLDPQSIHIASTGEPVR